MRADNSWGEQKHMTVLNFANMKAIELKGTEWHRMEYNKGCIAWQMFYYSFC